VTFPIGPANAPDAVDNAKVAVAAGNYTSISLLGAASGGSQTGTLVATYTDGTTTSFSQTFSNWVQTTPTVTQTNESVALAMSSYIDGTTLTTVSGSTYNLYGYSFPLNSAKTLQSITLPSSTAIKILSIVPVVATPVSLSSAFNVYGIFTDGTNVTNGGYDGQGYAYSSNLLGTSVLWNGTTFGMGPANALDAVGNATITLPSGKYSALNLLGSATNGKQAGTLLVTYSDGSTTSFTQSFSDWDVPSPPATQAGESLARGMAYRDVGTTTNSYSGQTVNVYGYGFPLNSAKTVASLTLPADTNIKSLAMSHTDANGDRQFRAARDLHRCAERQLQRVRECGHVPQRRCLRHHRQPGWKLDLYGGSVGGAGRSGQRTCAAIANHHVQSHSSASGGRNSDGQRNRFVGPARKLHHRAQRQLQHIGQCRHVPERGKLRRHRHPSGQQHLQRRA
jgi:hypothetical protein